MGGDRVYSRGGRGSRGGVEGGGGWWWWRGEGVVGGWVVVVEGGVGEKGVIGVVMVGVGAGIGRE